MSTQPNALRLAEWLESHDKEFYAQQHKCAAELRAQHKLIQKLTAALEAYKPFIPNTSAKEGGAAKHSANVIAADQFRDALAAAVAHK